MAELYRTREDGEEEMGGSLKSRSGRVRVRVMSFEYPSFRVSRLSAERRRRHNSESAERSQRLRRESDRVRFEEDHPWDQSPARMKRTAIEHSRSHGVNKG